jgi:hypothetical protein
MLAVISLDHNLYSTAATRFVTYLSRTLQGDEASFSFSKAETAREDYGLSE